MSMLLEIIFGLGIFCISLLLLFGIFPTTHRATTQAKNVSVATNLAREYLERAMALGFANATSFVPPAVTVPGQVNGVAVNTTFQGQVTVTPQGWPNVNNVVSEVRWREGPIQRSVRLQSYVADF
ncbi:MAG: hypothetical protein AMXMBFR33_49140 [Candidatus Xenobia bacterium]|jgi:type II secretory pathway pseudopilin PulG